ncbi:MAG: helix-turn-helix transcriptional regulator [Actinobacteria bacterium]|nr:helix-turn-helix transcriptional regulator [Actinomycetota bacterium]
MQPLERIGENIRSEREARGLSHEAVGGRCSLTAIEVGRIERGETDPGSVGLAQLSAVLGTTATACLRGVRWDQRQLRFVVEQRRG